jgi:hypothetical protein
MSICELEIGWAASANDRRYLRWELLACEEVLGAFQTAREDTLAVLFSGDRLRFRAWASSVVPSRDHDNDTTRKGALR